MKNKYLKQTKYYKKIKKKHNIFKYRIDTKNIK